MDFTSFSSAGSPSNTIAQYKKWWTLPDDEIPSTIAMLVDYLHTHQGSRQTQLIMGTRLYGNVSIMGLNGLTYSRMVVSQNAARDRLTYNVIQSCIDTVTAKIGKNRPKPLFLTSGGDYRLQQKAKNLGKFIDGIFYENDAYHQGSAIFRDAAVWGTGITHVFNHYGRIKHERVMPHELYVDEIEGFYGDPRQLHRVKNVDRDQLIDMFPGKKTAIRNANAANYDVLGGYQNISDIITVRESWHLPSGPEAKDGKHVITIDQAVLFSEDWNKDYFPFAMFHWNKKLVGFWGQSLVEQIQNIQLEINKLLWVLQRSYHLAGSFKVLLENGSKIVKEHLTNDVGAVINYTGTPPQYIVPPIVPTEYYQHLEGLISKAFQEAGVSMLSAGSMKPQGLDSGKALREYNDIESDRFMTVGHAYEKYFLDMAHLDIEVAKEIAETDGDYMVPGFNRNSVCNINWAKVQMTKDEFVMKAYPVSAMSDDPSDRLQTIQEYMQAGLMSPRTGRRLLDFPDLEQVEDLQNAEEEYLNEVLEKIVECELNAKDELVDEDGKPFVVVMPESYDDLSLAKELASEYYARGKKSGLEEFKLEMLRDFMKQIDVLTGVAAQATQVAQTIAQQAQLASQPNPGQGTPATISQPTANAMPAAVSPMVPNAA